MPAYILVRHVHDGIVGGLLEVWPRLAVALALALTALAPHGPVRVGIRSITMPPEVVLTAAVVAH